MRHQLAALVFLSLFAGCASFVQVTSDWDREADFARYGTYRWAPTSPSQIQTWSPDVSLVDERIRRAVDRELKAKGLELREDGDTDALFVYRIKFRDKVEVYRDTGYWRWGSASADEYREGTLLVSMVDPAMEDHVVWQGRAVGIVEETPEESDKRVDKAVAKMLESFPAR